MVQSPYISDTELNERYNEDTVGRKWRVPIVTKRAPINTYRKADEPITMNIKKPMKYDELKKLSNGMQKMYLEHLMDTYNVKRTELAAMLGIAPITLRKLLHSLELPIGSRGTSYRDTTKTPWSEFITADEVTEPVVEPVVEVTECATEEVVTPIACDTIKFTITGELNSCDISRKISAMIPDGTPCHISVKISKISTVGGVGGA